MALRAAIVRDNDDAASISGKSDSPSLGSHGKTPKKANRAILKPKFPTDQADKKPLGPPSVSSTINTSVTATALNAPPGSSLAAVNGQISAFGGVLVQTIQELQRTGRREVERTLIDTQEMLRDTFQEVIRLQSQIQELQEANEQLKISTERALVESEISHAAMRAAEESHYAELDGMEAQLAAAMHERSQLRAHNQEMQGAELQLVDLYIEMRDRHGLQEEKGWNSLKNRGSRYSKLSGVSSEQGELSEEEERKKLLDKGPLAIMGLLRASLVALRDFKLSTEQEFAKVKNRHRTQESKKILELEEEIAGLKKENEKAQILIGEALGRQRNEEQKQSWTLQEARKMVSDANDARIKLAKMVQDRDAELKETQEALDKALDEGKKRDTNVLKVIELEVTRERDIATFRSDAKKMRVEINQLTKQLKDLGADNSHMLTTKNALDKALKAEIARGRQREQSFNARRLKVMEEKIARLERERQLDEPDSPKELTRVDVAAFARSLSTASKPSERPLTAAGDRGGAGGNSLLTPLGPGRPQTASPGGAISRLESAMDAVAPLGGFTRGGAIGVQIPEGPGGDPAGPSTLGGRSVSGRTSKTPGTEPPASTRTPKPAFMSKNYRPPKEKEDPMSKREKELKERKEIDECIAKAKEGKLEKKTIMNSFKSAVRAGDRRMICPGWEELEAGTAHQDEVLKLDAYKV